MSALALLNVAEERRLAALAHAQAFLDANRDYVETLDAQERADLIEELTDKAERRYAARG